MKLSDVVHCQSILLQTFSLNFYAIFTNIHNLRKHILFWEFVIIFIQQFHIQVVQ